MRPRKSPPPPLDAAKLERLALRYVERYATTRGRLTDYLSRKLRERGWDSDGAPAVEPLVERFAELGYVDDRAWGEARAAAMARRGLGTRRVRQALGAAGVRGEDAEAIEAESADAALASAVAFARRKRIGAFAAVPPADRAAVERQVAQLVRAGHDLALARRIVRTTADDLAPMSRSDELLDDETRLIRSLS
ncbi:regulatory protein RecX [Sphingomonas sp. Y38-1Y]|uniref:regulatory protein RecX n=1 Tax=Sphingomonas sp. Y38-1Y TaxID=3078265 RepID=UPI0028E6D3E1|nr:RecX family transcriptional regulator [Sphingomonas sp. Y38-1Y]